MSGSWPQFLFLKTLSRKDKESQLQPPCLSRCCWTWPCLEYKKPHSDWMQIDMLPSTLTNEYGNDEKGNSKLSLLLHQLLQQPPTLLLLCSVLPCSLGTLPQQSNRHPHGKHNGDSPARPQPPQGMLSCVKCFSVSCPGGIIKKICLILFISSCLCPPKPGGVAHRQTGGSKEQQMLSHVHLSDLTVIYLARILHEANCCVCVSCAGLEVGNEQ